MQKDTYLCTAVQLSPQKQYIGRLIHVCTAVNVQSPINVYYVNHENVLKMWLYSKDNTTNTIKIRVWTKKNNNWYIFWIMWHVLLVTFQFILNQVQHRRQHITCCCMVVVYQEFFFPAGEHSCMIVLYNVELSALCIN